MPKEYQVQMEIAGLARRSSNATEGRTLERSRGPAAMFTKPDTGVGNWEDMI